MFTIRTHHVDAFLPKGDDYVKFCMEQIRQKKTEVSERLSEQELEKYVRLGIERAQRYQFGHGTATLAFLKLYFDVSLVFDERPLIKTILERDDWPPITRIQYIIDCVPEEEWLAARQAGPQAGTPPTPVAGA